MSFEAAERGYETPLARFQARTQSVNVEAVESPVLRELEVRQ